MSKRRENKRAQPYILEWAKNWQQPRPPLGAHWPNRGLHPEKCLISVKANGWIRTRCRYSECGSLGPNAENRERWASSEGNWEVPLYNSNQWTDLWPTQTHPTSLSVPHHLHHSHPYTIYNISEQFPLLNRDAFVVVHPSGPKHLLLVGPLLLLLLPLLLLLLQHPLLLKKGIVVKENQVSEQKEEKTLLSHYWLIDEKNRQSKKRGWL